MLWAFLVVFGAVMNATYYAFIKNMVRGVDPCVLAGGVFLSASAVLFAASAINGFPELGEDFLISVFATGSLNIIATLLYFRVLKTTDLSLAVPMVSFTPAFLVLTSFIILGEFPSVSGIFGILLIVAGGYLLNAGERNSGDAKGPLSGMPNNRGVVTMLAVAFLYSISSNFDKLAVLNSDPLFGSFAIYLVIGGSFLCASFAGNPESGRIYRRHLKKLMLGGAIISLVAMPVNTALTMQIVPYVISLKRMSIIFSVFYGGLLFREKHMWKRTAGALIMVAGAVLIVLF
ncbi:EamA family transporter [Candidatus Micrarchaeota archaeon]|nr:EamA family transporter [Candidatus Micrarchaeota archaeon]